MNLHPAQLANLAISTRIDDLLDAAVAAKAPAPIAPERELQIPPGLGPILRRQAAHRWQLPAVAQMTPQTIEAILRGALTGDHLRQWELFDLMFDTWPELLACQQELVEGVLELTPVFEPYADEDEEPTDAARERMRVVSAALRKMKPKAAADENGFPGTLKDLASAWFHGVVSLEIIEWHFVRAGALGTIVGPRATAWVHPSQTGWSTNGIYGLRVDRQGNANPFGGPSDTGAAAAGITEFPPHKFLVGIHKAKSGPALGGALLRALAWWWCAANFASDWLLNLAQVFGLPIRWANYDPNASQATIDAVCNMLQNMGSAGWAAFPAGTDLELKEAGASGDHSPQGELLDRADRYARMLLLGQTMSGSQDSSKGGGKAFGEVEGGVKEGRIRACARFVAEVANEQLVPSILELNYGDDDEAPTICLESKKEDDLVAGATVINTLATAGAGKIIPLSYISRRFNIPVPAAGEATLEAPKEEPSPAPTKPGQKPAKEIEDDDEPAQANNAGEGGGLDAALLAAAQSANPFSREINHLRAIADITDDAAFAERLAEFSKTL